MSKPALFLTLTGTAASALVVYGGGRVGPVAGATFPSSWLGVLARNHVNARKDPLPGVLLILGVAALVFVWLVTLRVATRRGWSLLRLWQMVGCWATPLALGPPLLSGDIYSYAAQGYLAQSGSSPYTSTPNDLGASVAAAVDPTWRSAHSPYGPLATALEHFSVSIGRGSIFGGVIALRVIAVLSVMVIAWCARELTSVVRGPIVFMLTIANPLLLLHFVSGSHLDAPMLALAMLALVAERQGHHVSALVLACASGMVKAQGFLVLVVIVVYLWHGVRVGRRPLLVEGAVSVALTATVLTLLVPDGTGWISSWNTPGQGSTPGAPAALLAGMLHPFVEVASYDDLMAGGRITMLCVGVVAIGWFLWTCQHRPITSTAGWCLMVFALINPVLYPWYLLSGIVGLALDARRWRRDWLIAISVWGTTLSVPGVSAVVAVWVWGVTDIGTLLWLVWALRGRPEFWRSLSAVRAPVNRETNTVD